MRVSECPCVSQIHEFVCRLRSGALDAELDELTRQHGYGKLHATDRHLSAPTLFDHAPWPPQDRRSKARVRRCTPCTQRECEGTHLARKGGQSCHVWRANSGVFCIVLPSRRRCRPSDAARKPWIQDSLCEMVICCAFARCMREECGCLRTRQRHC